jgi:hypothetical protein
MSTANKLFLPDRSHPRVGVAERLSSDSVCLVVVSSHFHNLHKDSPTKNLPRVVQTGAPSVSHR